MTGERSDGIPFPGAADTDPAGYIQTKTQKETMSSSPLPGCPMMAFISFSYVEGFAFMSTLYAAKVTDVYVEKPVNNVKNFVINTPNRV